MKDNDIDNLIERLQGFNGDKLQRDMTDGLDQWCRTRNARTRTLRRVAFVLLFLLTSTAIAMSALPLLRHLHATPDHSDAAPTAPAPQPDAALEPIPFDSAIVRTPTPKPVDYYYTGVAEDGYSVSYGHDTRTLTYTRYSGNHLIHTVVHNSPDIFLSDSAAVDSVALPQDNDSMAVLASRSLVPCDFQTVSPQGDALYYSIIDSANRHVSVRGDVAEWMGQPIRYNSLVMLPSSVAHDSIIYTVTAVADSAFMGHDEIETLVIPATVTSIGDNAFAGCLSLGFLQVLALQPPVAAPTSFDHVAAGLRLVVPCGTAADYANDVEWLYFRHIEDGCASDAPVIRVIRRH